MTNEADHEDLQAKKTKDFLETSQNSLEVRFVSLINSKPICPPYLSLVPFKNFGEVSDALVESKKDEAMGIKKNSKSQVKWKSLLD